MDTAAVVEALRGQGIDRGDLQAGHGTIQETHGQDSPSQGEGKVPYPEGHV